MCATHHSTTCLESLREFFNVDGARSIFIHHLEAELELLDFLGAYPGPDGPAVHA